ncbi:MAG: hypothetical protein ACRDI2_13550, partial [Chloroflexota bacterium]
LEITRYGVQVGQPLTGLRGILRGSPELVRPPAASGVAESAAGLDGVPETTSSLTPSPAIGEPIGGAGPPTPAGALHPPASFSAGAAMPSGSPARRGVNAR